MRWYRFIYRAVVTTNKSWSTFLEIRLILKRVLFMNTIANKVCYSHWHYMVWLASLWHWHYSSVALCFSERHLLWCRCFFVPPVFVLFIRCPQSHVELHQSSYWCKSGGFGQGTFMCFIFLFEMLFIFRAQHFFFSTKSHPQVLHIWWVKNEIYFAQEPPRLCLLIYFLSSFFLLIFVRFAVSRDFDWEIGNLTNVQKNSQVFNYFLSKTKKIFLPHK